MCIILESLAGCRTLKLRRNKESGRLDSAYETMKGDKNAKFNGTRSVSQLFGQAYGGAVVV